MKSAYKSVVKIILVNLMLSLALVGVTAATGEAAGYLWGVDSSFNALKKIDPSTGDVVDSKNLRYTGGIINSLAFGNGYLWGVDSSFNALKKIDPSTGDVVDSKNLRYTGGVINSLAFGNVNHLPILKKVKGLGLEP